MREPRAAVRLGPMGETANEGARPGVDVPPTRPTEAGSEITNPSRFPSQVIGTGTLKFMQFLPRLAESNVLDFCIEVRLRHRALLYSSAQVYYSSSKGVSEKCRCSANRIVLPGKKRSPTTAMLHGTSGVHFRMVRDA